MPQPESDKVWVMRRVPTPKGPVVIQAAATPEALRPLEAHPGLRAFRPAARQKEALLEIAASPDGCVTTAEAAGQLVGYAAFHRPSAFERWGEDPTGGIYELGAVEVAPPWRGYGLARHLLEASFATGRFEDKVVVATLYYWHYDLEHTGLSAYQYRKRLEALYGSVGFVPFTTDDPEIRGYLENTLMARIGPRTPKHVIEAFHALRFRSPPPEAAPWSFPS
ncbi:GNAT family N-acetyltransferase [Marinithermus hydrothermalis]|uniref:GCN5-related N-acetyltransferase n=1 Tax=Marinithermus hydrothermalis (strain DSM 14884 / JCM 11576 / T1) TaxID=869210 RepID=F2NLX5_MARHT|nr:GNAT family N-acetyltransferase [Marinithermus hydrothermalis]AEB11232.1 GCN5-related N-acetyltransferase [Marinithermus hydrothermalis DSM 14884]